MNHHTGNYRSVWAYLFSRKFIDANYEGHKFSLQIDQTPDKVTIKMDRPEVYEYLKEELDHVNPTKIHNSLERYHQSQLVVLKPDWMNYGKYYVTTHPNDNPDKSTHKYQVNIDNHSELKYHDIMNMRYDLDLSRKKASNLDNKIRRAIKKILINTFLSIVQRTSS